MNNVQKILIATYLPITIFILILNILYPGAAFVKCIKFTTIITLFLVALSIKKNFLEQRIMNLAIFFVSIGDFFLNFCSIIPKLSDKVMPLGSLAFLLAYLALILAFQKNFKIGISELLGIIPILMIFIPNFIKLSSYISGLIFYGLIIFSLVLCYMVWTSISTIFRGYFNPQVSRHAALSGYLILISDMAVAHSMFNPAFADQFVPWLNNVIWASYVPAWTLIVLIIAEKNLLSSSP